MTDKTTDTSKKMTFDIGGASKEYDIVDMHDVVREVAYDKFEYFEEDLREMFSIASDAEIDVCCQPLERHVSDVYAAVACCAAEALGELVRMRDAGTAEKSDMCATIIKDFVAALANAVELTIVTSVAVSKRKNSEASDKLVKKLMKELNKLATKSTTH